MSDDTAHPNSGVGGPLEDLVAAENYDGCVELLARIEQQRPLTPAELVQKSRCLQLASEEFGGLEEAEAALKAALDAAEDYVPALIDLGWFRFAVQDDAKTGLLYFRRAEELSRAALEEALEGKQKCLEELQAE